MGTKRRYRQTAKKPVSREAYDRMNRHDRMTYPEIRTQAMREAAARR